jgi:hypothetical protein
VRKQCYARWVEQGKLSAGKAAHELACMEAIVRDYENAHETSNPAPVEDRHSLVTRKLP